MGSGTFRFAMGSHSCPWKGVIVKATLFLTTRAIWNFPRRIMLRVAAAGVLGSGAIFAIDQPVVISAYQGPCREGDFSANLGTARTVIRRALERNSHFLAFPECFLSGYEDRGAVERGARRLDDPDVRGFIEESAAHEMVVLIGMARWSGTNLYNSVLVIHQGRLLGMYDKVMLTGGDREPLRFTAGNQVPVFEAQGVRFGVLICADTSYPYVGLAARLQGAELLFTPHYNEIGVDTVDDHRRWVRNCHVGLAAQLKTAVARANVIRTQRAGQVGYGDSFILSPQGEPLAEARLFRTELISATLDPTMYRGPHVWADLEQTPTWLRSQVADLLTHFRRPQTDPELRTWLENMIQFHHFSPGEVSAATGLALHEIREARDRLAISDNPPARKKGDPLRVLPYPAGRHPRRGFFEGAVAPQRETKVSVFTPWDDHAYVVADVPEAIFSNLGLTYLAHTHIPTIWDEQGVQLPRLEWNRLPDGTFSMERELPNGIAFGTRVRPGTDGVRFELWLQNGSDAPLTGLRVQNCVMLGAAPGFGPPSASNRVFAVPFAAARSDNASRWIITGWEGCARAWGNERVPCLHADPVFPDCAPGETVRLTGWLSFFEGSDVYGELSRLSELGVIPTNP
jgi:predicted amidohydrolase